MANNPTITEWGLYFQKGDGLDNRSIVMKAFANFCNGADDKLSIPGYCQLGGKVSGHTKFQDGDEILSSYVQSIEKIPNSNTTEDAIGFTMCATTQSGSKYYFCSTDHNKYMRQMLSDLTRRGKLYPRQHHYWGRGPKSDDLL